MNNTLRLDGTITMLSPLSHIGESLGIDSYLSTDIIIGPDGQPNECFLYSGNSFRGILRDAAAKYLLDHLGGIAIPVDAFHLLFSGGSIGGDQSIDIDQARMYRKLLPMFSIFGGGVGNQIMEGKLKIGSMYPLVRECQRVLPEHLRQDGAPSWKEWTYEKSYTRRDDSKQENFRDYLVSDETVKQLEVKEKPLLGEGKAPKKAKEGPATQMRYTVELLAAGAVLYQRVHLQNLTALELGAFVSALEEFTKAPYLGGKSGTGHGLCEIQYDYFLPGEKESKGKFLHVRENALWLSQPAAEAKQEYDDFLLRQYNQYLKENAAELQQLLAGGTK